MNCGWRELLRLRLFDGNIGPVYFASVETTVNIDQRVLLEAELQARREGKSLGALVEEALRIVLPSVPAQTHKTSPDDLADGLSADDPFFTSLEEIRATGRLPAPHRETKVF